MHPMFDDRGAHARIADWHRQAERDGAARAIRRARRAHRRHGVPGKPAGSFARRVLAALGARSLRPSAPAPGQAPKAAS